MVGRWCLSVSVWLKKKRKEMERVCWGCASVLDGALRESAGRRNESDLLSSESKCRYCNTEGHAPPPPIPLPLLFLTANVRFDRGVSFSAGASCGCGGSVEHFVHVHPCGLASVSWSPCAQQDFVHKAICLLAPPPPFPIGPLLSE